MHQAGHHAVARDIDDHEAPTRHNDANDEGHHKRGKTAQDDEQEL
ncbi:hypothetical protein GCM10009848_29600 [Micromonospora lupini]